MLYGKDARPKLRAMRDELIREFKESGIPADRELDHAKIVRPSIEAIETAFDDFIQERMGQSCTMNAMSRL